MLEPHEDVISKLREVERDQPFVLTGIGMDFVEGRFTTPIRDAAALARSLQKFCPDVVDQGAGTLEALERDLLSTREFFLWWD